jgi:protein SCO1/2
MKSKTVIPVGVISLLVVLLLALLLWQPKIKEEPMTPSLPIGGDFVLKSSAGEVDLKAYRGKVVAIYFGYTWCPDICPTSLSLLSAAMSGLTPQELDQMQGFFITLDPARDNLKRLDEYASYFNEKIMGLAGSEAEIAEIAARYGAIYRQTEKDEKGNYSVDHSSRLYLLDDNGKLRKILQHGTSAEATLEELQQLLHTRQ